MAVVLKTTVRETVPGVRIPLPPPEDIRKAFILSVLWRLIDPIPTFNPSISPALIQSVRLQSPSGARQRIGRETRVAEGAAMNPLRFGQPIRREGQPE